MKATLISEYTRPDKTLADTQGNVQILHGGNVFVGWGSEPFFSECSPEAGLLFDASFPPVVESYRAFRFPWKGESQTRPAVVAESGEGDEVKLYVSWNGATEVATWRVLAGPGPDGPDELKPVVSRPTQRLRGRRDAANGRAVPHRKGRGQLGQRTRYLPGRQTARPVF